MNDYQDVFKRVEKKYLLTIEQYDAFVALIAPYTTPDTYGKSSISNVYYDTDDFELIQKSLDKPIYKEKLRLRGYGNIQTDSAVFVEIKKKYNGIVYKRRVKMRLTEAQIFLTTGLTQTPKTQIHEELDYFRRFHCVKPAMYIAYDRIAIVGTDNEQLRITFDRNIRYRTDNLSLAGGMNEKTILPIDFVLMEIKIPCAMPLFLSRILSSLEIFPSSYSKYGNCYLDCMSKAKSLESEDMLSVYNYSVN